jgi:hypothetical protein
MVDTSQLSREELEQLLRDAEQKVMPDYQPPKNGSVEPATKTVRVHIDRQRLREIAPSKYWAGAQDNRIDDTLHLLSYCVLDDGGGYMPHKDAFVQLGELPLAQIEKLLEGFNKAVGEIAVPLVNETV